MVDVDRVCDTFLTRTRGLMCSPKRTILLDPGEHTSVTLHMVFVCFPITAVFLDETYTVLRTERLRPFIDTARATCRYVLETPEEIDVDVGEQLDISV